MLWDRRLARAASGECRDRAGPAERCFRRSLTRVTSLGCPTGKRRAVPISLTIEPVSVTGVPVSALPSRNAPLPPSPLGGEGGKTRFFGWRLPCAVDPLDSQWHHCRPLGCERRTSQLPAGSVDVRSLAFAHVNHQSLTPQALHEIVERLRSRPTVRQSLYIVERNQVHMRLPAMEKLCQLVRLSLAVGQSTKQHIFIRYLAPCLLEEIIGAGKDGLESRLVIGRHN